MKLVYDKSKAILLFKLTILYLVLSTSGSFKYAISFIVVAALLLSKRRVCINRAKWKFLFPVVILLAIGILQLVFIEDISLKFFLKRLFLMCYPMLLGISICEAESQHSMKMFMDMQFWAICITQILTIGFSANDLMESQYAFIFGAYTIYYLYIKKKKMLFFSILMLVIANKRIALAGAIICLFILLIYDLGILIHKKYIDKMIAVVSLIATYIYIYACKTYIIEDVFRKLHINTNGRIDTWRNFRDIYYISPIFRGTGIGKVGMVLNQLNIPTFEMLHNDILTYYIEIGFIGFGIFLVSLFNMGQACSENRKRLVITLIIVYTLINYCTDNISIYINYWTPLSVMILSIINANMKGEKANSYKLERV